MYAAFRNSRATLLIEHGVENDVYLIPDTRQVIPQYQDIWYPHEHLLIVSGTGVV